MVSVSGSNETHILDQLRKDKASWSLAVAFSPTTSAANSDVNIRNRSLALLALHSHHHPTTRVTEDEALVVYILDEEIKYHQKADHYRSSISLACYLLSRYRNPSHLWAIWVARECSYDTSILVDSHYLYYAAGGLDNATAHVERSDVREIVGGASEDSGRMHWWTFMVDDNKGDEGRALDAVKGLVLARIAHDRSCGITDAVVENFVSKSWRSDNTRWAESLLDDE